MSRYYYHICANIRVPYCKEYTYDMCYDTPNRILTTEHFELLKSRITDQQKLTDNTTILITSITLLGVK